MKRAAHLRELMDDPHADLVRLNNTYRLFGPVNRCLSGWQIVYRKYVHQLVKPVGEEPIRILDIGAGGGDVLRLLTACAKRYNQTFSAVAIDPDPRAGDFFHAQDNPAHVQYESITHHTLIERKERFDCVTSNHLLHHLTPAEINAFCRDVEQLVTQKVIFNDIHRGWLAYALFRMLFPLAFFHSFIWVDGCRSIRRAYTVQEMKQIVPPGWTVVRQFPFRLLVMFDAAQN